MFGYVTLDRETLSPQDANRYQAYRRSLAQMLRRRHGVFAPIALSHDLTFLEILLTDVYGDGSKAAPLDPRFANGFCGYAADMSVALAFHNAQDDWSDDHNYMALALLRHLRSRYATISHRYPRQCVAISHGLQQLQRCEAQRCTDPTIPAGYFGQLTAEVVAPIKGPYADALRQLGAGLGEFSYLMDAYDDLLDDLHAHRYNPLATLAQSPDYEQQCQALLQDAMARCLAGFEQLDGARQDTLLCNVLHSGVWQQYRALHCEVKQKPFRVPLPSVLFQRGTRK
ncbi:DUF5685 family protein [uncultured Ruthenibacterium sp.]|uniref:DUF5685 family protein n=1 Tax=uncultured Ruthenibacterium sp. TaxID=1905347 RepID=UPI00349E82A9